MIAITKTTTSWRAIADASQLTANEVAFSGDFLFAADGITPLMVWDATLDSGAGNVRAMTAPEIAARDAQRPVLVAQAAKAAATTGIDTGQLQAGDKMERLVRALALVVLDEVNILRAASVPALTARTTAQLVNAIKAKVAATSE